MDHYEDYSTLEAQLLQRARQRNIPMTGSIELLPLCNMNCDMCFVRLSKDEMEQKGQLLRKDDWIAIGKEMQAAGVVFLLLTGGEPLLHPDFREIYLAMKDLGMILTINTNATLIDKEWAEFFGQHKPRRINITLYGASNETYENLCHYPGGYDRVMEAVRLLNEQSVDVKLAGNIVPENKKDFHELRKSAESLDVPIVMDSYMMPATRERSRAFHAASRLSPQEAAEVYLEIIRSQMSEEEFTIYCDAKVAQVHEIEQQVSQPEFTSPPPRISTCMAGRCSFAVNWQGHLRPCVIVTTPERSVLEHGFTKAWSQISEAVDQIRFHPRCSVCKYQGICPICAAANLLEAGSYDGVPDYLCQYSEALYHCLRSASSRQQTASSEIVQSR